MFFPEKCDTSWNLHISWQLRFANCPKLESVYIPTSVTEISDKAFKNSSAVTIKGSYGSYAEEYAKANNIPFEGISAYDVGDVNMDGRIDILDATLIQKYVAGIVELSAEQSILPIITTMVTSR